MVGWGLLNSCFEFIMEFVIEMILFVSFYVILEHPLLTPFKGSTLMEFDICYFVEIVTIATNIAIL